MDLKQSIVSEQKTITSWSSETVDTKINELLHQGWHYLHPMLVIQSFGQMTYMQTVVKYQTLKSGNRTLKVNSPYNTTEE